MYCDENSKKRRKIKGDLFVWGFVLVALAAIAVGDVGQGPMLARAG